MISIQTQQILVPKQVYIGDRAELQCTFTSSSELKAVGFIQELDYSEYEIKDVQLISTGDNSYRLTVSFVPWRTGLISLPDYQLGDDFFVHFNSVTIDSITQRDSVTSLKESASPLLLPGTIYKLYSGLICIVLFLILAIRLIVKHKKVSLFIKTRVLMCKYNKNRRKTIKLLNRLNKNTQITDHDTAEQLQNIMRKYLEVRFDYPFTKTVTSEISRAFYKITNGFLSEKKEEAVEQIVSGFVRTDYIRYSSGSSFLQNEKKELIERFCKNIECLESVEKKDADDKEAVNEKDKNEKEETDA